MGLDVNSHIVYGAIIKQKTRSTSVTKYDENTGQAYDKTVSEIYWTFDDGTECNVDQIRNDEMAPVDIFYWDYDRDEEVVGVEISTIDAGVRGGMSGSPYTPVEIVTDSYDEILKQVTGSNKPRLYHFCSLSY